MKRTVTSIALATIMLVGGPFASLATQAQPELHPDVAYALSAEPGGVATSSTSAIWIGTGMRLQVLTGVERSVGTCLTGSICAYSASATGGTKLSWSTCGSKSTAALARVGSIANGRASGTLYAKQGATTRASTGGDSYANVPAAYQPLITAVFC